MNDATWTRIRHIAANASLELAARVRAVLDLVSREVCRGPVIVYMKDWRARYPGQMGISDYALWYMTGVRIRAPMYGVLPADTEWVRDIQKAECKDAQLGDPKGDFAKREGLLNHARCLLDQRQIVVFFNRRRDDIRAETPLEHADCELLMSVATFVEPMLSEIRRKGPSAAERRRARKIRQHLSKLHEVLVTTPQFAVGRDEAFGVHRSGQAAPEAPPRAMELIQSQILIAASAMYCDRGPVLARIYDLERGKLEEGEAASCLYLRPGRFFGVPEDLLDPSQETNERPVDPKADGSWVGITAWVAYNNKALLVEDFRSPEAEDPKLPLSPWSIDTFRLGSSARDRHPRMLRSELAVPIRSPSGHASSAYSTWSRQWQGSSS